MANKWMTQLTKGVGEMADNLPSPSDHIIPMPSPSLNWAVGNGGLVQGKAITLFGPESGGKSLLQQLIYIELQRLFPDGICVHNDAEFAFNKDWFTKLGGDPTRLIVRPTNEPTEIFDYVENELQEMIQDGCPIVGWGVDSVKSIRFPKDRKNKSTDMVMGGAGASYLGAAFKGILPVIRRHLITTILVQQVYMEMDQYKAMSRPYIVPDGFALKHFSDYMLQVERIETKVGKILEGKNIYGTDAQVGHVLRVKAQKNRVGAPYRVAELSLRYDRGICDIGGELFKLAKSLNVIKKVANPSTGKLSMWGYEGNPCATSEGGMREWVEEHPEFHNEILQQCYAVGDEAVDAHNASLATTDIDVEVDL